MEDHASSTPRITLDWSKLLGFDQVTRQIAVPCARGLSDPRLAGIGAKVGVIKPTVLSSPR